MDEEIEFLKKFSESFGPAGFEREAGGIIKEYGSRYADEIITDKLGSIVFKKIGNRERPHVLLAGHIDEVGFVISGIDKTGFLSFNPLGGWFDQSLLSQRVTIRTRKKDLLGVISAKPPHLLSEEERKKVVKKEDMFIDIGATSKEEAEEMGIMIGDPVVPWSPFTIIKNGEVAMGKAFDDRIGAFIITQIMKEMKEKKMDHPNTIFGAATVQEEVGARGATTVAHLVDPDVAIVLEVDIAGDTPGIKFREAQSKMGKGPAIVTLDASMIPNQSLKNSVIETAEEMNLPFQISQVAKGGTDAGRIHIHKIGCPSIVIGIPTRHIHSHVGLFSFKDVENTIKLVIELIKRFDESTVNDFVAI